MELEEYINTVKVKLNASSAISSIEIIDERTFWDRGYFRARLTLSSKQRLRKRWDNVTHFPDLPNFPHHVHIGEESNVESSQCRNIRELIDLVEQEMTF